MTMVESVKPSMAKIENAREHCRKLRSVHNRIWLIRILMCELTTKKFDWSQPIHDHVTHMSNLAAKLTTLGMEVHKRFLVFLVLFIINSLPFEFSQFQELKAMLVQEEGRLEKMKDQVAHLVGLGSASNNTGKPSKKDKKKDKAFIKGLESKIQKKKKLSEKKGLVRQGTHYVFVCFESNLIEVPNNTWWIDSGATTHVSHIKQGFRSIQPIRGAEQYLFMGNKTKALIEDIGTYRLILDTGCHIDLEECLYVPECTRNLVSISRLDNLGFHIKFGHGGSGTLFDSLYRFNFDAKFSESLFNIASQGIKRSASNESSSFLWHQRLGHISKERMMMLVKNEILPQLDYSDLDVCVDCIKGKQTKHIVKKSAMSSTQLLELIHIDICGPFDAPSWSDEKYFITFIDDYSRYGYTYQLHEKSQSMNVLEVFINEVERQLY
ncbi:hypothetical protein V2J09_000954 [Rumex salicifolius]